MNPDNPPVILSLSSLDPSGCQGIQADIETSASLGCHCTSVATSLCSNGDIENCDVSPVDSLLIIEQARSLLENMDVRAIKIGFPGSVANVEAIHSILKDYSHIPVILKPNLGMWSPENAQGQEKNLARAIASLLLPLAELAVLSHEDTQYLAQGCDTLDAIAQNLMGSGCQYLLATTPGPSKYQTQSALYGINGLIVNHPHNPNRLNDCDHNSTLAGAITAMRAHECPIETAVEQALHFTQQAMDSARELGFNRPTPYRLFWADKNNRKNEGVMNPDYTH